MSITTKTGDAGLTTSFQGSRVKKNCNVIKFSSAIDEAVSFMGVARSEISHEDINKRLFEIQNDLLCFSILKHSDILKRIEQMENYIVSNEKKVIDGKFVVFGDHKLSALVHYARALTRKLEIAYIDAFGIKDKTTLIYFNRLSDYLFVIGEFVHHNL